MALPKAVENSASIIKHVNVCLLAKLAKNYDECETHAEFDIRNNNLDVKIKNVIGELQKYEIKILGDDVTDDNEGINKEDSDRLYTENSDREMMHTENSDKEFMYIEGSNNETMDKDDSDEESTDNEYKGNLISIVSSLLILYKELLCNCSWNSENSKECANKLDECFYVKYKIKLEDVLKKNILCDSQAVYEKILDELCKKLTSQDFKKYPGQVEVYCDLVQNFKDFDVKVNSLKIFPVALILMDDYIESNKTKGLLCCQVLLNILSTKDLENGNYYDVIYLSVKNAINHKDIKITELSQACALDLCNIYPADVKDKKLDEMYSTALEQIHTESNLYRKATFLNYTTKILQMLQIKCVGKSFFKSVISDAIESCLIKPVAEILAEPSLKCLEEWIKYCWPVWKLSVDYKVLCALLKYDTTCKLDESSYLVKNLIQTLISFCTPEEQSVFMAHFAMGRNNNTIPKMDGLKKDIGVNTDVIE